MPNTKTKILDSAERLFGENGIEGASLRAITSAAGANLGSIHYYFGSKMNLIREVFQRRLDQFSQKWAEDAAKLTSDNGGPGFKDIWLNVSRAIFEFKDRNPDFARFVGRLNQANTEDMRSVMSEVAIDFESSFFAANMSQFENFPVEIQEEAQIQCIVLMHLIFQAALTQEILIIDCNDRGLNLDEDRLINMLADLAAGSLKNLKEKAANL